MNYFFDTEFHEYHRQLKIYGIPVGKPTPTIDLISIGIVAEDGREYYAISKDFNLKEAWNRYNIKQSHNLFGGHDYKVYWLRDNVLKLIFDEYYIEVFDCNMPTFNYKSFKYLINKIGKTNKRIAKEIKDFESFEGFPVVEIGDTIDFKLNSNYEDRMKVLISKHLNPEFYADYCNYDWVVFCWLFGKMKDLPKGFPYCCNDIQQLLKFKYKRYLDRFKAEHTYEEWYNELITLKEFPINRNEHNALSDAKYCKDVYNFINKNKDIDL
jgi:hypothetical protein